MEDGVFAEVTPGGPRGLTVLLHTHVCQVRLDLMVPRSPVTRPTRTQHTGPTGVSRGQEWRDSATSKGGGTPLEVSSSGGGAWVAGATGGASRG